MGLYSTVAGLVQERIMAPRILHFGSTQLYWECHQYDTCEIYPAGLPPLDNNAPELIAFKQRYQPLEAINDTAQLLAFWLEIVVSFSKRDLTRKKINWSHYQEYKRDEGETL
jgi:hypothetical protein